MLQKPTRGHKWPWYWFWPDYIAESVTDIDFAYLKAQGIRAIYIDLDNTVVHHGTHEVNPATTQALLAQPLEIYIATNRPKSRPLKNLKDDLHATGVVHPRGLLGKPFPRYYTASLKVRKLKPHQAVMIGDRYLQDIYGANSSGLKTIVVRKLGQPISWWDRVVSAIEARYTDRLARRYQPIADGVNSPRNDQS